MMVDAGGTRNLRTSACELPTLPCTMLRTPTKHFVIFVCVLAGMYRCLNGNFIKPTDMCDGHDGCGDGSDERDCGMYI